ncbi:MAG: hypothetical protein SFU91_04730 [Chloroherpetonaceae bacterium]|nr:hypothetical protein [Chloroherpetonaceae bacterium]
MKKKIISILIIVMSFITLPYGSVAQTVNEKLEKFASIRIENGQLVTSDVELLFPEFIQTQKLRLNGGNPKSAAVFQTVNSIAHEALAADLVFTVQIAKPRAKTNTLLSSIVSEKAGIKAALVEKIQMVQSKGSAKSAVVMKEMKSSSTVLVASMEEFESAYPNLVSNKVSLVSESKLTPSMKESKGLNYEQISITLIRELKESSETPVAGR